MNTKKHIEPPRPKAKKPGGIRKKSILILGGLPYLCGRFIPYTGTLVHVCMLYPLICIFIIYCLYRGVSRRYRGSREGNAKSQLTNVAEIGIPLVFIMLLIISFFISVKGMLVFDKPFMYGLQTRMKSKVDVEAIRAWLQSLGDEDYDGSDHTDNRYLRNRSEWPEPLRELKPSRIFLSADENGNAKVRLWWGSSPIEGHWGVEIGAENMEIPSSDFSMYGEYRLPVEPGVYVWRGLE